MKKNITLLFALLSFSYVSKAQFITISEARAKLAGTVVTVRGRVINSSELGTTIRYFNRIPSISCRKRWDSST